MFFVVQVVLVLTLGATVFFLVANLSHLCENMLIHFTNSLAEVFL